MRQFVLVAAIVSLFALAPEGLMAGDREIAQKIATSLHKSGKLKDYSVRVKFNNGRAYLSGHVSSRRQAKLAVDHVKRMRGIQRVVNQLTVASPGNVENTLRQSATGKNPVVRTSANSPASARRVAQPAMPIAQGSGNRSPQAPAQMPPAQMTENDPAYQGAVNGGMVYQGPGGGRPLPAYVPGSPSPVSPARFDQPYMPNYAWPSYAAYPNYAAVTYPKQYSPTAWPFIGPFYPYPQVPLGWRKVTLEWDDGWWMLDFKQR